MKVQDLFETIPQSFDHILVFSVEFKGHETSRLM